MESTIPGLISLIVSLFSAYFLFHRHQNRVLATKAVLLIPDKIISDNESQ